MPRKRLSRAAIKPAERVYSTREQAILVLLATEVCEPSVRGIYGALKQAIPKPSITRWTQRLEKEGLLRRQAALGEARGNFVKFTLTAKGKRNADALGYP
jgi:DNA-binding MarR family transcriptional regulator